MCFSVGVYFCVFSYHSWPPKKLGLFSVYGRVHFLRKNLISLEKHNNCSFVVYHGVYFSLSSSLLSVSVSYSLFSFFLLGFLLFGFIILFIIHTAKTFHIAFVFYRETCIYQKCGKTVTQLWQKHFYLPWSCQ